LVSVRLENIVKKFRDVVAVNGVSLEIKDKEFFVLLGPSGSGKSTILNIVAGLEPPTSGDVYFDDELVTHLPPEKRDVAMVFQTYALYPHMTAFDNIAFPLRVRKYPKEEIKKKVEEVAEMLRIKHLLHKKPYEMSGGERQRVALARAIVREPKIFLLDEPLSNIDAKLRVYMRAELSRLQKDLKVTTIYVTHDQVEALSMGDRIAVIHQGKVMQIDEPLKLFKKPATLFVAGFIGSPPMNFFNCTLEEEGDKYFLDAGFFKVPLDEEFFNTLRSRATSKELVLGVRPKDLIVRRERPPTDGAFEAEVYAVEPLGTETILNLKVDDNIYKAVVEPEFRASLGEKVVACIDLDRSHIFDRRTERAIL